MADGNYTYTYGEHFIKHVSIESLCCTPDFSKKLLEIYFKYDPKKNYEN